MKVPGVASKIAAVAAEAPDLSHHLNAQPVARLSESQKNWLDNSVVHAGPLDVAPALETLGQISKRATLLPLPRTKPSFKDFHPDAPIKLSETVGRVALIHPSTDAERITQKLWFQAPNPKVTAKDIQVRAHEIFNKTGDFKGIVKEQIAHDVSATQLIEALDGTHPTLTRSYIENKLDSMGFPSPAKWRQSLDESIVMHTRRKLDQEGLSHLDGAGVKVWVIEPHAPLHNDVVTTLFDDPQFGLAPGAAVEKKYTATGEANPLFLDRDLNAMVSRLTLQAEKGATPDALSAQLAMEFEQLEVKRFEAFDQKIIEQIRDFTASDAQVLNFSAGYSPSLSELTAWVHRFVDSAPKLAQTLGSEMPLFPALQARKKIFSLLAASTVSARKLSLEKWGYAEATKAAADKGKIIVVGAGNWQASANELAQKATSSLPDEFALNPYARGEHVIVMGASKTNGTSLDVSDDSVAEFSSHGSAHHGITTTTQGENVAVPYPLFIAANGRVNGTSLSAPTTGALAVLYKQANPESSFQDFKDLLIKHSVPTGAPKAAEGAGMLDVLNAALEVGQQYRAQK